MFCEKMIFATGNTSSSTIFHGCGSSGGGGGGGGRGS